MGVPFWRAHFWDFALQKGPFLVEIEVSSLKNAHFANFKDKQFLKSSKSYILRHFLFTVSQICLAKESKFRRYCTLSKEGLEIPHWHTMNGNVLEECFQATSLPVCPDPVTLLKDLKSVGKKTDKKSKAKICPSPTCPMQITIHSQRALNRLLTGIKWYEYTRTVWSAHINEIRPGDLTSSWGMRHVGPSNHANLDGHFVLRVPFSN